MKAAVRHELQEGRRSLSPSSVRDEGQQSFQIHRLLKDAEPEILEEGVDQGVKLLQKLKALMQEKASNGSDASQWIKQIGKRASETRCIDL